MYQPTNSKSFYSAINQNKNLEMYKVTDKYLEQYANTACRSKEWSSLPFQEFVKVFMGENTPYNSILITWGTGVGKTCGAVQITETLRQTVQMFNKSIYIIAPANLQQNYKETLMSQCSGKILDTEENISKTYKFYSYIKFGKLVESIYENDGREALMKKFSNCVFVIDEAHNLNNLKEDEDSKEEIKEEDGEVERKLLNTLELLFGTIKNSKLILLTATPIRNHISEIASLVNLLRLNNNEEKIDEEKAFNPIDPEYLLQMFKGYISFVRGNSQISFPRIENQGVIINPYPRYTPRGENVEYEMKSTKVIPCEMIGEQLAYYMFNSLEKKRNDKFNTNLETISMIALPVYDDSGMISTLSITKTTLLGKYIIPKKNGKVSLSVEGRIDIKKPVEQSFFLCKEYLPYFSTKLNKLLDNLLQPGVHYVYSRLVKFGTNIISVACQLFGWNVLHVNSEGAVTYNYSILEYNNIERRCWCGKLESDHKANHKFEQGHIVTYTGDTNANQKALKKLLAIVNSEENKFGQRCKVFIGSRVSGEGVNYRRLRYVHVMEPWWNNTVLQQVIGRAARNCSHFDLPKEYQNVLVYRYCTIFPKNLDSIRDIYPQFNKFRSLLQSKLNNETVDLSMYRLAENKDISIAYLTRLLKMAAVDCENNYIWNRVWTQAEINYLKKTHKYSVNGKEIPIDDSAIDLLNVGEDYSPDCEYMECNYQCMRDVPIKTEDTSILYNYINVNKQKILVKINQIINFIKSLHTPIFSLAKLMDYFNVNVKQTTGYTKLDYYNIFDAITEMLTNQDIVFEWNGIQGRLVMIEREEGIIYSFDAYAKYLDNPSVIPEYFKYNNVFTNGSNVLINMNIVNKTIPEHNDYTQETVKNINEAMAIINSNDNVGPRLMELFDNMNNFIYSDIDLTPFNLFYEELDNVRSEELMKYVKYYMEKNYRSVSDDFYISHTNISMQPSEIEDNINEWTIKFICRYKEDGYWNYYKIINTSHGETPFESISFSPLNFNYIVQQKGISDMYFDIDNEELRQYFGKIITKLISNFNANGIRRAPEQASIIYEFFSPTNTNDIYNVKVINDSRGQMKRNDKIDKRSISTGQICTSTTKLAMTRTLQMVNEKEIDDIIYNINNNRKYNNSLARCKKIEITFRTLDWEQRNGKRWFYMFGDYDFSSN